jgi:acid phosphatase family membrane protein YuiD
MELMNASLIHITAHKLGNARMRCRNHGIMPCSHASRVLALAGCFALP